MQLKNVLQSTLKMGLLMFTEVNVFASKNRRVLEEAENIHYKWVGGRLFI